MLQSQCHYASPCLNHSAGDLPQSQCHYISPLASTVDPTTLVACLDHWPYSDLSQSLTLATMLVACLNHWPYYTGDSPRSLTPLCWWLALITLTPDGLSQSLTLLCWWLTSIIDPTMLVACLNHWPYYAGGLSQSLTPLCWWLVSIIDPSYYAGDYMLVAYLDHWPHYTGGSPRSLTPLC